MSVLGIIGIILGGIIVLVFGLHFPLLRYNIHMLKTKGSIIHSSKRWFVYRTSSPDIRVTTTHYCPENYDDDPNNYARSIALTWGGFNIWFYYAHDFIQVEKDKLWCTEDKSKYYGFDSIDGGYMWRNIWWGNHLYDNPFLRTKCTKKYVYDMCRNKLEDRNKFDRYEDDRYFPYVKVIRNTTYTDKNHETNPVKEIKFWLEEWWWENPILNRLGIHIPKKRVFLEFETTGIGVDDDWKGNVTGSSIRIDSESEPVLFDMYKDTLKGKMTTSEFTHHLKNRIEQFMTTDRKY